jgi:cytidine deaminase
MPMPLTPEEREDLCDKAREVAHSAYAEYSDFRVGAAVLGERGIYTGVNVENSSYGLSLCAERAALANAIAHGDRRLRGIAVACINAPANGFSPSLLPCGACRQWLAELAPEAEIIIAGSDHVYHLDELMPLSFQLEKT